MELLIVTGMSGAGKSVAVNAMEDVGIYCVDNMPPELIPKFAQLFQRTPGIDRVAVVVDARGKERFPQLFDALEEMDREKIAYRIVYLDAGEEELVRRYKITRRRHPLLTDRRLSLSDAIAEERRMLEPARVRADYYLDTTLLGESQLRQDIKDLFQTKEEGDFVIHCISFGFKYGIPMDADLVLDVRCLPNPFYLPELREKTGLDAEVQRYVLNSEKTTGFLQRFYDLVDYMLPLYRQEQKSQLLIAVGCTGGRHRSVTVIQELTAHLRQAGYRVCSGHRDIEKKRPR